MLRGLLDFLSDYTVKYNKPSLFRRIMRLLVVHLSDIHLTGSTDPIFEKAHFITDTTKNLDYELDACLVIFTGDIAFSGRESEYLAALELIDQIARSLCGHLSNRILGEAVPTFVAAVPGNHDFDFSVNERVRKLIRDSVVKDHSQVTDPSVVEVCTEGQLVFFNFLDSVETNKRQIGSAGYHKQLYYEYEMEILDERITVLCCNTAWLSEINENQGDLFFPSEAIPTDTSSSSLVISAFHHPYNWIEANAARKFRRSIEAVSDIVLTGHEHESYRRTQEVDGGQHNTYIEGGVLQESNDASSSAFNAIVIDTNDRKQKFAHFKWNGTAYSTSSGTLAGKEGAGLGWVDLKTNLLRISQLFNLSEETSTFLDDPGVVLQHSERGTLSLSDIFVYPDLQEVSFEVEGHVRRIRGENVPAEIDSAK